MLLQSHQIPCKRCWLAAYIHKLLHTIVDDLQQGLRIDSVTRWIKYYEIRLILYVVYDPEHITGDELTVVKSVEPSIHTGSLHSFLNYLHADDLLCNRRKKLGYRSGSAVEIEYDCILCVTHI